MKTVIEKIRQIDADICEKHPAYKRFVNLLGLEQKFDLWISRLFPPAAKWFTDEITVKRFSDSQKAEFLRLL